MKTIIPLQEINEQNRDKVGGKAYALSVLACNWLCVPAAVAVSIDAYPPDKRRRDLDNIQKALLDALVHADVIEDDSLIDALSIQRHEAKDEGEVIVRIQPYAKEMQDLRV